MFSPVTGGPGKHFAGAAGILRILALDTSAGWIVSAFTAVSCAAYLRIL